MFVVRINPKMPNSKLKKNRAFAVPLILLAFCLPGFQNLDADAASPAAAVPKKIPTSVTENVQREFDFCAKGVSSEKFQDDLSSFREGSKNASEMMNGPSFFGAGHGVRSSLRAAMAGLKGTVGICESFADACKKADPVEGGDGEEKYTLKETVQGSFQTLGISSGAETFSDAKSCLKIYETVVGRLAGEMASMERLMGETHEFMHNITDDPLKSAAIGGAVIGGGLLIKNMLDDDDKDKVAGSKKDDGKSDDGKDDEDEDKPIAYATDANCEKPNVLSSDVCVAKYSSDCYQNPNMSTCSSFNTTYCNDVPTDEKAKKALGEKAGSGKSSSYCLYVSARSVCANNAGTMPLTCSWLSNVEANKGNGQICSTLGSLISSACLVQTTSANFAAACTSNPNDAICNSSLKNHVPGASTSGTQSVAQSVSSSPSVIGTNATNSSGASTTSGGTASGTFSAALASVGSAISSTLGFGGGSSSGETAQVGQGYFGSSTMGSYAAQERPVDIRPSSASIFNSEAFIATCKDGRLANVSRGDCPRPN